MDELPVLIKTPRAQSSLLQAELNMAELTPVPFCPGKNTLGTTSMLSKAKVVPSKMSSAL